MKAKKAANIEKLASISNHSNIMAQEQAQVKKHQVNDAQAEKMILG